MNRPPNTVGLERPRRPPKLKPGWELTARQIRLALFGGAAAICAIIAFIVFFSLPHRLTAEERVIIQQYDAVRARLAADDLAGARSAASRLTELARNERRISKAAAALANAGSLPDARAAFASISSRVIKLVSGNPGFYRIGCSTTMSRCPAPCEPCATLKFGDWIQNSPQVENPFMGQTHPDCGVLKE